MGPPGEYGIHDYEFVACKVIEKDGLSKGSLKLIENEIVNQDCIASLYVVKAKKAIEAPDRFYIFMEYANGGDLKELFEAKNYEISFKTIHKIMRQLVQGYSATIGELVVHRDLKLQNIMVHFQGKTTYLMDMPKEEKKLFLKNVDLENTDFQVKIADFGLSK